MMACSKWMRYLPIESMVFFSSWISSNSQALFTSSFCCFLGVGSPWVVDLLGWGRVADGLGSATSAIPLCCMAFSTPSLSLSFRTSFEALSSQCPKLDNLITQIYPSIECHPQHHFLEGHFTHLKVNHFLSLKISSDAGTFSAKYESNEGSVR